MASSPRKKKEKKGKEKEGAPSSDTNASPCGPEASGPGSPQLVKLNIGGYRYITTAFTLTSRGENFFTRLLNNSLQNMKDDEGYYFIDRDGEYFKPLLSYLRTGELRIPVGMSRICVEREAQFYLIDLRDDAFYESLPPALSPPPPVSITMPPSNSAPMPILPTAGAITRTAPPMIRYEGLYLQRAKRDGSFFAFYQFLKNGKVRYLTVDPRNSSNRPTYGQYEVVEGTWIFVKNVEGSPRKQSMLMATQGGIREENYLNIQWYFPNEHDKNLLEPRLFYYPSYEPIIGMVFSDENLQFVRAPNRATSSSGGVYHRLHFTDHETVAITVIDKDSYQRIRNTSRRKAKYRIHKEELVTKIEIADDDFSSSIISLGAILIEEVEALAHPPLSPTSPRASTSSSGLTTGHMFSTPSHPNMFRYYQAVDYLTEEDDEEEEIDIYEFLRTSAPPTVVGIGGPSNAPAVPPPLGNGRMGDSDEEEIMRR